MLRDLVARVRAVLITPRRELPTTLADSGAPGAVFFPYVALLAAVGPIMLFVSDGLIGTYHPATRIFNVTIPGSWTREPAAALVKMALGYALGVGAWAMLAFAMAWLAPRFGGRGDRPDAIKASAYTMTPVWLSGALLGFGSVPYLDFLAGVGLIAGLAYGVLIGIIAVPLHLGTPEVKAPGHILASLGLTVAAVMCAYYVLSAVVSMIFP
jgi:hypothetical protein